MPGDPGVLAVNTRVRSTNAKCTRGCGCNGHPAFPTPSLGGRFINASGASRCEVANVRLDVIASEAKQSTLSLRLDGLLRFARNDGLQLNRRGSLKIEFVAKHKRAIPPAVVAREGGCEIYLRPHPEERRKPRLEGWPRVHALCPSFETLASQAPQDEVGILHRLEGGRSSIPRRE